MGFARQEYEFLAEIGLGPENLGGYVNGGWKATGSVISSVSPSSNQVILIFWLIRFLHILIIKGIRSLLKKVFVLHYHRTLLFLIVQLIGDTESILVQCKEDQRIRKF